MLMTTLRRDDDVRDLVSLGLVELASIDASRRDPLLDAEIEATAARLRAAWQGRTAGQIGELEPARALYRSFGIDPTRHRPSSEALVRRILGGKGFPRVAPLVDLANLWSVSSCLPVGLYDAGRIEGASVAVRRGKQGESYEGIRKGEIRATGRLVLADDRGPFGNPSADSARTAVSSATRDCLCVMFAPATTAVGALDRWAAWLRERALAYFGGTARSGVLP